MGRGLTLLLLALALPCSGKGPPAAPPLPASLELSTGSLCSTPELASALQKTAFASVVGPGRPAQPDLRLDCSEAAAGRLALAVWDPSRAKPLSRLEFRTEGAPAQALAEEAARRLLADKAVSAAAVEARLRANQRLSGEGMASRAAGLWRQAADQLFESLESRLVPLFIYGGLCEAHARMGQAPQARWYFLAYVESSGLELEAVDKSCLAALAPGPSSPPDKPRARGEDLLRGLRESAARAGWNSALRDFLSRLQEAPWDEPSYEALSRLYAEAGWKELSGVWKGRGRLARRVNQDRRAWDKLASFLKK